MENKRKISIRYIKSGSIDAIVPDDIDMKDEDELVAFADKVLEEAGDEELKSGMRDTETEFFTEAPLVESIENFEYKPLYSSNLWKEYLR